jgi:uncharacterized protein (DUF2249 family)
MTDTEATPAPVIDVRTIPHHQRHQIIFDMLRTLRPSEHFMVVADHEPRPLQFHIETRYPDEFVWEYVEFGPDIWRVKIGREGSSCECCCGS